MLVCLGCAVPSILYAGVLSIPASALLPKNNGVSYSTNGAYLGVGDTVAAPSFLAPVFLQQGATITDIILEAYDNSGDPEFGGHVIMNLVALRYNTIGVIATLGTGKGAAPGDTRVTATSNAVVDNSEFGYGISVDIINGSGGAWSQLFYKAIIYYTEKCPADFDKDGDVDGSDLEYFSQDFGEINCSAN